MTRDEIPELVNEIARRARAAKLHVVAAESCTGGWIAKVITDLRDSSHWFERGYVTYSNEAKMQDLGVSKDTLAAHGAVSEATVREMAIGALRASGADVSVAVSGIAGPTGGTPEKPVGTVWFAVARRHGASSASRVAGADVGSAADLATDVNSSHRLFPGDREAVRRSSVQYALELVLQHALQKAP
jgi:nicotinamide-nucleotide amidase